MAATLCDLMGIAHLYATTLAVVIFFTLCEIPEDAAYLQYGLYAHSVWGVTILFFRHLQDISDHRRSFSTLLFATALCVYLGVPAAAGLSFVILLFAAFLVKNSLKDRILCRKNFPDDLELGEGTPLSKHSFFGLVTKSNNTIPDFRPPKDCLDRSHNEPSGGKSFHNSSLSSRSYAADQVARIDSGLKPRHNIVQKYTFQPEFEDFRNRFLPLTHPLQRPHSPVSYLPGEGSVHLSDYDGSIKSCLYRQADDFDRLFGGS